MLTRKLLSCEIWLWRHKLFRIQNQLKKNLHHRMYESSRKRYIIMLSGKYRFLRLDNEDKSCLEPKKSWKKFTFHHRMCDSFKKSYIIMLSRKLLNFETWLWRQKLFVNKKQLQKISYSSQYVWVIQKKLHPFAILQTLDFWDLVIQTKFV